MVEVTDEITHLLSCFFEQSEDVFSFLKEQYGFTRAAGMARISRGRITLSPFDAARYLYNPQKSFWAVVRYEKDDLALELSYGDMDFVMESHMYYDQTNRLSLSDILRSVKKPHGSVEPQYWVMTTDHMTKHLETLSDNVVHFKRYFLKYDSDIIEQAALMRAEAIKDAIYQQNQKNLEYISLMSARAMQDHNYKRVIELLRPYEEFLDDQNMHKLETARRRLLQG